MDERPTINFDVVPQEVKDRLCAATLKAVREFIVQPGGKEFLDRKTEERKKRLEAAKLKKQNDD